MHCAGVDIFKSILSITFLYIWISCGEDDKGAATLARLEVNLQPARIGRQDNYVQVSRGGELFQQHCAECHGTDGEGAPKWRQRDADGFFPAPPLNGTGHAWHHPQKMLHDAIKNGSPGGQGKMPAWGGQLSEQDIEDIIAWFKSMWPQPVYEAWHQMNERNKGGKDALRVLQQRENIQLYHQNAVITDWYDRSMGR